MPPDPLRRCFVVAAPLCLALLVVSGTAWHARRVAAHQSRLDLERCRQLAAEIRALRAAPHTALAARQSEQQLLLAIERAAQEAEIPDAELLRITPQRARRLGRSAQVQQPTSVEIRQLTLGQLARFLAAPSLAATGLEATSIRLAAPRVPPGASETEKWTCESILTYLVFSPE